MSQSAFYRGVERAQAACRGHGPDRAEAAAAVHAALAPVFAATAAAPHRACAAGCATCCHYPVGVTLAEAQLLAEAVRALPAPSATAVATAVAADAAATAALAWNALARAHRPCPLLRDGNCTVYAARPLPCRAWSSRDALACARSAATGEPVPFDDEALALGLGAGSVLAGAHGHRELRAALAALLALPEGAGDADRRLAFASARAAGGDASAG